jgi:IRX15/IRX15L/GXM
MLSSPASDFDAAFEEAIRKGWMATNQYRHLANELCAAPKTSLLVFGAGHDSLFWSQCVTGDLAFVEDNPKYLALASATARVVLHQFQSRVGEWNEVPDVPVLVDRPWDFVLVDGPTGFGPNQPGRQFSVTWAQRLAQQRVFVHDYERAWERTVCDKIFGVPAKVIRSDGTKAGDLAVFEIARAR